MYRKFSSKCKKEGNKKNKINLFSSDECVHEYIYKKFEKIKK